MCVSCAPVPWRYYYAESSSGEVLYLSCFINEDIPYRIRFSQQGIRISAALEVFKGREYIAIYIEVPEGKIVKLNNATAQVFWSVKNQPEKAAFRKINIVDKLLILIPKTQERLLDANEPMVGQTVKAEWGEWLDKSYSLAASLDMPDADEIRVVLPQFIVNAELVTLPELHFHRKWTVTLINLIGEVHC